MEFSKEIERIIRYAAEEAIRTGWNVICLEHYLLAIIRDENNSAYRFLWNIGIAQKIKEELLKNIDLGTIAKGIELEDLKNNEDSETIFKLLIFELRGTSEYHNPTAAHLLGVILKDGNTRAAAILYEMGLDYDLASPDLTLPKDLPNFTPTDSADNNRTNIFQEESEDEKNEDFSLEYIIENYGTDLTFKALNGELDPLIGREKEIKRICQILGRRRKNNPILVGNPGVGKSSIVEGIAQMIANENVPPQLHNKRIISIEIGSILAGTKLRGEFESRINKILKAVKQHPDVILFIDEIHTIVGAGNPTGSLDAADLMKPALSRGDFQCIGATTYDEYRKYIEKDGALERRFQKVVIEEPNHKETISILNGMKHIYEEFHNVHYTSDAIIACINLSSRYITERAFPDKAIDILDEAGALAKGRILEGAADIKRLSKNISSLKKQKREAISNENFKEGARLLSKEIEKRTELDNIIKYINTSDKFIATVTENDICDIVSTMTGIPVNKIATSEGNRLLSMEKILKEKLIGQDDAIERVTKAIRRNRAGLKDPEKPIGTFLFLGPTGVGKTHLAKTLSEFMFDTPDALIRIDMSEYMEKFSVSRLIGAPPGYIGFEEGGQLSERVRKRPYCVVLLDEIEKAHPDIFNLLLQILDEGRLTDSSGRYIDFRNTIIIMTSNIGSRDVSHFGEGLGYKKADAQGRSELHKALIDKAIQKSFTPEFINRLDEKIYFNSLSKEDLCKIIKIEIKHISKRVEEAGFKLKVTESAIDFLIQKGYDPKFGARPLKRVLQKYIEDTVAEEILKGLPIGTTLILKSDKAKEKLILNTKI